MHLAQLFSRKRKNENEYADFQLAGYNLNDITIQGKLYLKIIMKKGSFFLSQEYP